MTTVQESLDYALQALRSVDLPEAGRESELLVQHVLGLSQTTLYAWPEKGVQARLVERLRKAVERRKAREPLAYILGEWEFYGLSFTVGPSVMVPRSETETLVDTARRWNQKGVRKRDQLVIADVGTGSGCIAIALARHLSRVKVYAMDISPAALSVAEQNCRRHGVEQQVVLLLGDLLDPLPEPVDLIVANLPYVPAAMLAALQPEIRLYEPPCAITPGDDGTELNCRLLAEAAFRLKPNGSVLLEMDPSQGRALEAAARYSFPGASTRVVNDLSGWERVLVVENMADT